MSRADQQKLPPDYRRAADFARRDHRIVTAERGISSYARFVSSVLGAVDRKGKGILSEAESSRIQVPELRARVFDARGSGKGPRQVNAGALVSAIEGLQDEWGSANIMDGMIGLASTVVAGGSARNTAARDLDALVASGEIDGLVGKRTLEGPRTLKSSDLPLLARAVNDGGFQYATQELVPELQSQVATSSKSSAGPPGSKWGSSGSARADWISETDTFPAQVWVFRNPATDDAVAFSIRKGSL